MSALPATIPLRFPDPTVREIVETYLPHAARGAAPRAHAERERILRLFLETHGETRLSEARPFHLRLWVDTQEQFKSDWTVKRVLSTIQRPFNWAARLGMIDRNPFWGVSHRAGKRGRPMTEEEYRRLLRATDPIFRRVLVWLRYTGCRPGEMSKARWEHIDVGRCVLVLKEHKTSRTQKDPQPRTIALHPVALKLLGWLKRHSVPGQETIFINARGVAWTRNALSLRIQALRRKCELPDDCRLYGTRHAFGTRAVLNGVDIKTLSQLLGHTNVRTTEIYVHLAGETEHLTDAVTRMFRSQRQPG